MSEFSMFYKLFGSLHECILHVLSVRLTRELSLLPILPVWLECDFGISEIPWVKIENLVRLLKYLCCNVYSPSKMLEIFLVWPKEAIFIVISNFVILSRFLLLRCKVVSLDTNQLWRNKGTQFLQIFNSF